MGDVGGDTESPILSQQIMTQTVVILDELICRYTSMAVVILVLAVVILNVLICCDTWMTVVILVWLL